MNRRAFLAAVASAPVIGVAVSPAAASLCGDPASDLAHWFFRAHDQFNALTGSTDEEFDRASAELLDPVYDAIYAGVPVPTSDAGLRDLLRLANRSEVMIDPEAIAQVTGAALAYVDGRAAA